MRQDKNLLYQRDKLNEPTKEGPLSFVPNLAQFQQSAGSTTLYNSLSEYQLHRIRQLHLKNEKKICENAALADFLARKGRSKDDTILSAILHYLSLLPKYLMLRCNSCFSPLYVT
jgi:hypothetical protein